jgi:YfiH family protein
MPAKSKSARRKKGATRTRASSTPHNWSERDVKGVRILEVPALAKFPWLVHGFSTRAGGDSELDGSKVLSLGFTEWDRRESVLENRRRFQTALHANQMALAPLEQFHSDVIHVFEGVPGEASRGDGSATNRPGLLLGVQTADCVPILLVDPKKRAVAAVHAGWRGTLARIAVKAVGRMQMRFDSKAADIVAAIGPAIGGCCYEVGTEVAAEFLSQFADAPDFFDEFRTGDEPNPIQWLNQMPPGHQPPPKNVLLDLRNANRAQLRGIGLQDKNIFVSNLCTACRPDLFFSYRKQSAMSGRQMSVIGIRE